MTPKDKAKELVGRFIDIIPCNDNELSEDEMYKEQLHSAKQCALICVDDELKILDDLGNKLYTKLGTDSYMERCVIYDLGKELEEVKQEINKL